MQCIYCHAWNEDDSPRCSRCGRRATQSNSAPYPFVANLALAIENPPQTAANQNGNSRNGSASSKAADPRTLDPKLDSKEDETQPWLFRATDSLGRPRIVPIPVLAPRVNPVVPKSRSTRRAQAEGDGLQHLLDLQDSLQADSSPKIDTVIDCDAPVAPTPQRVVAAAVDAGLIAIGVALFLGIFLMAGGGLGLNRMSALIVLGTTLAVALIYRVLWCLGCGDTPGTCSVGMRIVNFDGRPPDRTERAKRLAAGFLSFLSAGLGLIWVLVDEENLAWHDHISKTFPTPL